MIIIEDFLIFKNKITKLKLSCKLQICSFYCELYEKKDLAIKILGRSKLRGGNPAFF